MKQENILKLDKSLCAHVFWFARTKPGLLDGANKATWYMNFPGLSSHPSQLLLAHLLCTAFPTNQLL